MNKKVIHQKTDACSVVALTDLNLPMERTSISPVAFALWVRSLLQNWRQGTVACKGRSDVNRTNKKPWKQKGTGRARAGTARSPLWRGGGVIFGPMARVRRLKENKKIRQSVMLGLLQDRVDHGRLFSLDWLADGHPSTARAYEALKNAHLHSAKMVLFIAPNDLVTYASFNNLPYVTVLFFDQANAFDVALGSNWVFLKKDEQLFKEMVTRWI